jgi:hypothetical protein
MVLTRHQARGGHRVPVPDTPRKLVDKLSLAVAFTALLISLVTFGLQFIVHDSVSYVLSVPSNIAQPENTYVNVPLDIFNNGNRPAALIEAKATFILQKVVGSNEKLTDNDCQQPAPRIMELLPNSVDTKDDPEFAPTYRYSGAIAGGSVTIENMSFRLFYKNNAQHYVEGIVCLELKFAEERGIIKDITRILEGVSVKVMSPNKSADVTTIPVATFEKSAVRVIKGWHIEWPFS